MFAGIQGKIVDISFHDVVVLTSGGVAYEIGINELTFSKISTLEEVYLHIYHQVTQEKEYLYGFYEKDEKFLFNELLKISGVGGRVALSLLSIGYQNLAQAIAANDLLTITDIKGIGLKTGEKIILELKSKDIVKQLGVVSTAKTQMSSPGVLPEDLHESIKKTLVHLGYPEKLVEKTLRGLPEGVKTADVIIPYAIKQMS